MKQNRKNIENIKNITNQIKNKKAKPKNKNKAVIVVVMNRNSKLKTNVVNKMNLLVHLKNNFNIKEKLKRKIIRKKKGIKR